MGKFVILTELFILPIVLGRYHGFDSYKQYYDHRNGGELYYTTTTSNTKESFYDGWPRSGDNYASVPRCIKQTFCEDVPDYPQKFVNQMLAKNVSLLQYAYQDVIALSPRLDNEEEPLCLSTERLILPKTAVNMKDQWMYIVQAEDNFRQSLRIEACKEEDAKCRIIDGFAEGYITSCKQKYIYRELSAISADGEIVRDFFRLPASCCCHVEFNAEEERARIK